MSTTQAHVQANFFGLSNQEIHAVIRRVNSAVQRLGAQTEMGKDVIELQGICEDLADYAELMRQHEGKIAPLLSEAHSKLVARKAVKKTPPPRKK